MKLRWRRRDVIFQVPRPGTRLSTAAALHSDQGCLDIWRLICIVVSSQDGKDRWDKARGEVRRLRSDKIRISSGMTNGIKRYMLEVQVVLTTT
jgi:hypothetical protein